MEELRREGLEVSESLVDRLAYSHDAWPLELKAAVLGRPHWLPMAVAWPETTEQVSVLLRWAQRHRVPVVPYGGGSGIVGGALADGSALVVDLKRMGRVLEVDESSLWVRAQAGISGQYLEDRLNARGLTLGHFPQSMRASTLGGWLAHRAAGVASTRYGKIEDMVLALEVVLPDGEVVRTPRVPRAATGPDLDQLFVGSEGCYGIITEATLQLHALPEVRRWRCYAVGEFERGLEAVRRVLQRDLRPAIVRLYDAVEAAPYLEPWGRAGECLLLWGCEGYADMVALEVEHIEAACRGQGWSDLGDGPAELWWSRRFNTLGLVRPLLESRGVADALEVSADWSCLGRVYEGMRGAMLAAVGERGKVYGHLSHAYRTGANLYMIFSAEAEDEEAVAHTYWRVLEAAFEACLSLGGSLSHHHGVGLAKARWLGREWGASGLRVLWRLQQALDPGGIMNPGKGLHPEVGDA